mmetsp:Transcript_13001/g.16164  ORF Transcript_13001/g.16164 Transcript_13001/m.16164 type:complete len:205 (-) Transcript_13001:818-1432(-)
MLFYACKMAEQQQQQATGGTYYNDYVTGQPGVQVVKADAQTYAPPQAPQQYPVAQAINVSSNVNTRQYGSNQQYQQFQFQPQSQSQSQPQFQSQQQQQSQPHPTIYSGYIAQPVTYANPVVQEPVAAVYVAQPVPVDQSRYTYTAAPAYTQPAYGFSNYGNQPMQRDEVLQYRNRYYEQERRREETELACCAALTTLCLCFAFN